MFNFKLEYFSFIKNFIQIKLAMLFVFWFYICSILWVHIISYTVFHEIFVFFFFTTFFKGTWKIIIKYFNKMLFHIFFPDCFFIFLIIGLLMFIIYVSHMHNYNNFQKLVKLIILGLFIEIIILMYLFKFHNVFIFGIVNFILHHELFF